MIMPLELGENSYNIVIERGAARALPADWRLQRRVLLVTDDGVPEDIVRRVEAQCPRVRRVTIPAGEKHKTFDTVIRLCEAMLEESFSRKDCVVAVGGGLCSDTAGFAAACYMRGIDFYNVPTTLLSQVDASVGGKTGVNLNGVKNIVGAFHQPGGVVIDPELLDTLPERQLASGMAEVIKMALIADRELFEALERGDELPLEEIIFRAVDGKRRIVEEDEREGGTRHLLNFGHTLGHGVESAAAGALQHGECVAIGMVPMCAEDVRARLIPVLQRYHLPVSTDLPKEQIWEAVQHDKKATASGITAVFVDEIGEGYAKTLPPEELKTILEGAWQA